MVGWNVSRTGMIHMGQGPFGSGCDMGYLLTPNPTMGSVHIQSCRYFDSIPEIQSFLESVTDQWSSFSMIPAVYVLEAGKKVVPLDDQIVMNEIWPLTYRARKREVK
jgi:hypothetical protein